MNIKQFSKIVLFSSISILSFSCSKNDNGNNGSASSSTVYTLGLGVNTTSSTSNYVLQTNDIMNGTISLENKGILQDGYRDYASFYSKFYSIGGLGVTDVNTYSLDGSNQLTVTKGLTFESANNQLVDDGTGSTLAGVSIPTGPTVGLNAQFYTINAATNTLGVKVNVPVNSIYPTSKDWIFHTGFQVRGNQAFESFYPVDATTYATQNTDTNYVAVLSYPGFQLQKIIKDTRTGPSGAFNTRSGLFKTESGDIYAVSNTSFTNGYSQSTKPAGILKIANGSIDFDANYFFNTDAATNGGKIAHAIYVGDGKLFAEITTKDSANTINQRWSDGSLRLAIVDLVGQKITAVSNTPTFSGGGGRSFAAFVDNGKAYCAITVNDVLNIYQVDIASATLTKGAVVSASFVGGLARLK